MNEKEIEEWVLWYSQKKPLYELLASEVAEIIEKILDAENITYSNIEYREKEIEKFKNKIKGDIKFSPKDMQDLAGIQIICYVNSDVEKISEIIKMVFEIDNIRSVDKSKILGTDKIGYRGIHIVAKLPPDRIKLHEFKKFDGLYFEIQIRTILQHAWAEIQHDRNYKFSGTLPSEVQRRFALISASLEMADNEFNTIAQLIERYSQDVSEKTKEGALNIPINSTSLRQFLISKFGDIEGIEYVFGPKDGVSKTIIEELDIMKIKTLKDLQDILPLNFKDNLEKYKGEEHNFAGVIRTILIIYNADEYFKKAWRRKWQSLSKDKIYLEYGINPTELSTKYGLD